MQQGVLEVAVTGVYHQARLLVDDDDVVVFVDDVQRNLFRLDVGLARRIGEHDGDDVVGLHLIVLLDGLLVDQDVTRLGRVLHAVARDVGEVVGEVGVDALRLLAWVDGHAYVFVELGAFFVFRKHVILADFVEVVVHLLMMNFWLMTWPSLVVTLRKYMPLVRWSTGITV